MKKAFGSRLTTRDVSDSIRSSRYPRCMRPNSCADSSDGFARRWSGKAVQFCASKAASASRIEVEISLRERVLRPPVTVSTARIAHPFGIEPVVLSRLDDVELLAEKVRALVMRRASRDVYDAYWLLQRGIALDPETFLRKMDYYRRAGTHLSPVRAVERAIADLEARDASHTRTELANLFPAAQRTLDFAVIAADVARALRAWLPLVRTRASRKSSTR